MKSRPHAHPAATRSPERPLLEPQPETNRPESPQIENITAAAYRLVTLACVLQRTSLGRTSVYQQIKAGTFPRPVKVGTASRWVETELDQWMQRLMRART